MKNLSEKKAELKRQLNEIRDIESKENEKNIAELLKAVKPEIDAYKSLRNFNKRGKIKVELTYDIDLSLDLYDFSHLDLGEFEGGCSIDSVREPRKHKIAQFIAEDKFGNMCIDEYKYLIEVHPDIKKHCDNFLKAKKTLAKKVSKTAEKLNIDEETAFDAVFRKLD